MQRIFVSVSQRRFFRRTFCCIYKSPVHGTTFLRLIFLKPKNAARLFALFVFVDMPCAVLDFASVFWFYVVRHPHCGHYQLLKMQWSNNKETIRNMKTVTSERNIQQSTTWLLTYRFVFRARHVFAEKFESGSIAGKREKNWRCQSSGILILAAATPNAMNTLHALLRSLICHTEIFVFCLFDNLTRKKSPLSVQTNFRLIFLPFVCFLSEIYCRYWLLRTSVNAIVAHMQIVFCFFSVILFLLM